MRTRLRSVAGLWCLAPALALGPPLHLATYFPGCEPIPPQVTSVYTGKGRPIPRPRFAPVEVFLAGDRPQRPYAVVGEVRVSTRSRNASLQNLIQHASREARKLGGDAIVDVRPLPASADPQGRRVLTARVASWV